MMRISRFVDHRIERHQSAGRGHAQPTAAQFHKVVEPRPRMTLKPAADRSLGLDDREGEGTIVGSNASPEVASPADVFEGERGSMLLMDAAGMHRRRWRRGR